MQTTVVWTYSSAYANGQTSRIYGRCMVNISWYEFLLGMRLAKQGFAKGIKVTNLLINEMSCDFVDICLLAIIAIQLK